MEQIRLTIQNLIQKTLLERIASSFPPLSFFIKKKAFPVGIHFVKSFARLTGLKLTW